MRAGKVTFGLVMVASGMALAQKYVPPPPPLTVDPCSTQANPLLPKDLTARVQPVCPPPAASVTGRPAAGEKTAADKFPFPGSDPAQARTSPAGGVADQFPYPGETPRSPDAVPEGDTKRYVPDPPVPESPGTPDDSSSSSSSSASGGSAEPPPANTDEGAGDTAHARSHGRRMLPKVSAVSPEERVSEDLDVAKFYSDRGNFQAAYLRAKDATRLMPEDAETHFALAQAAEKLKRKDEAAAEYALYIKLDPAGQKTPLAQRALSQLR